MLRALLKRIREWQIGRQFKKMGKDRKYQEMILKLQRQFAESDTETIQRLNNY